MQWCIESYFSLLASKVKGLTEFVIIINLWLIVFASDPPTKFIIQSWTPSGHGCLLGFHYTCRLTGLTAAVQILRNHTELIFFVRL